MIPQIIINELLTLIVPLKNHLSELFQQKNKEDISGGFNYSRRILHTHACFIYFLLFGVIFRLFGRYWANFGAWLGLEKIFGV